jgi:response regulator RpfG family c-di-GMP phosphodiesterase
LKLKLEKLGVSVIRAFEGLEGVRHAFTRPADAIILDFNLPNGQGDFVLRRLKSNPLTKNIPVIVLTGVKDQSLEQRMMSLGAAKFLTKPLKFDHLMEALHQHIDISV